MQRDRQTKKLHRLLLISLIAAAMACLFALPFGVLAAESDPSVAVRSTTPNGTVQIGETTYNVTDRASLVAANRALLENDASGSAGGSVSGTFGGVAFDGFEAVYEQIYEQLLANCTSELTDGDSLLTDNKAVTKTGETVIVKISGTVKLDGNYYEVHTNGKILFVSDGPATLEIGSTGRFSIGWVNTGVLQDNTCVAIQGKNSENRIKIVYTGSEIKEKPAFNLMGGDLYLHQVDVSGFRFGASEGGDAVVYAGNGFNNKRGLYMSRAAMHDISGQKSPGFFLKAYTESAENDRNAKSQIFLYQNSFYNCTVVGNSNYAGGPVIRSFAADNSYLRVEKCDFSNNRTNSSATASGGGAIYWKSAAGRAELINCTFRKNQTNAVGGAIFNTGDMAVVGCSFTQNTAVQGGGAIASEPPRTSQHFSNIDTNNLVGSLTLDDKTTISENSTNGYGGAIYFNVLIGDNGSTADPKIWIETFEMRIDVAGASITNNSAQNGGAIAMLLNYGNYNYETGISIRAGSMLTGNTATQNGGAIWMGSTLECARKNNEGVTLHGGVLQSNSAKNGGAVYIETALNGENPMNFTLLDGQMHSNTATSCGGAAYIAGGNFVMEGGTVQNSSAPNGGAVFMTAGTCTVSGGEVNGNVATQNGGGVYMEEGTFALSGGKVIKNTAMQNGGGVYLGGGNMTMSLGELSENKAQIGAGAYVQAVDENEGIFVSGGLVTSNIAQENGGGFVVLNGSYKMTGGVVENNDAAQNGGGIYVASTGGAKVTVEFRSGTVRNNEAGVNGGAFAVVGQKDGSETIAVTIGVNQAHFDEEGNEINCEHGYQNTDLVYTCPVFENNQAAQNGGAIYITGGSSTKLDTFCLVETGSTAVGNGKSNFMMVEGGTVTLTTADSSGNDWVHGKITITREIHVVAGDMLLDGSMSNPLITAPITVDVDKTGGSFTDKRENASTGKQYYKIQYFENFVDPETNKETGQYTVFQVESNTQHVILYTLYVHDGYDIKGWWTQDTDGNPIEQYIPNTPYTITKDLMLYAKWVPIGYYVKFEAGADDFRGTMPTDLYYEYDKSYTLPLNGYFVKGKLFVGWYYGEEALLTDGQSVSNLTLTRNVTLTAVWELCPHEDEEKFTYTVEGDDTLVRTCYCEACIQYAQLIAEDRDYDPDAAPYEAMLNCYDDPSNQGISPTWSPVRSYSGEKYSMVPFDPSASDFRIGAGKYTVSITGGATTLEVKFEIRKVKQAPPAKPTYNSETANQTNTITIDSVATETERLVYLIKWYDENGVLQEYDSWLAYAEATATGFELSTDYTNYYVYAKFAGDDNYEESVTVMADAVLFFTGLNINVYFICENGIHYTAGAIEGQRGLQIDISAVDGYFLYDTKVTQNCSDASLQTVTTRKTYRIDLPTSSKKLDITVTINGVKKQTAVGAEIEAAEEFGEVKGTTATIAKDSAYTVAFILENYELYTDLALHFGSNLPVGTTVILIDKTNTNAPVYYSYLVSELTQTIPLANSFLRMGSPTQRFTPPASPVDPLHYQLVIDFSDADGGCTADALTTALTATISTEEINKGAQAFPQKAVTVTLKDIASSIQKTAESGMSATLTVSYADAEQEARASKWERRAAVLVLKATTALPVDARLEAIDSKQGRVLRNSTPDGLFIIPIQNEGEITITLLSDLLPIKEATYIFEVTYLSACSPEGGSPINGLELDGKLDVTLTKAADAAEPSAGLTGIKQIYDAGETVKVTVVAQDYGDADLGLRLLVKQNGVYVDTSWQPTGAVAEGENEVPIGTLTGSCCILLEIKSNETVLLSVPYYFVVRETAQE